MSMIHSESKAALVYFCARAVANSCISRSDKFLADAHALVRVTAQAYLPICIISSVLALCVFAYAWLSASANA